MLDVTFLYNRTDEAREREHAGGIPDRLKPARKAHQGADQPAAMPAEGGVQ